MKLNELMKELLTWAARRASPFSSAECYEAIKGVDDIKELSDTLRRLWCGGVLARKKLDGFRFSYALASAKLPGFEIYALLDAEPAAPALPDQAADPVCDSSVVVPQPALAAPKPKPKLEPAAEKQIPVFLLKDAPAPGINISAPTDHFSGIGKPVPQRVSYMIDDSGRLDIGDDDTLISLPVAEVKRLLAFLDRVSGLLCG